MHFPGAVALVMVLPVVAIGPMAFAIRDDYGFSQSDIGATFAAFFLTSALVSGTGGRLVGRIGSLATVRLGLFGSALVSAALALSTTRGVVYLAALVGGSLNGITAVAVSLTIMSQVASHRRGLAFGLRTAGLPSAAAFAGLGAGKAVVPVGLCCLAVEGDGGRSALGAGVDVNKAVTRLVCDLHGTFWDVEIA